MSRISNPPIESRMEELGLAIDAAIKAGDKIMEIYTTDFEIKTKNDDSPVTKADLISNQTIKAILEKSGHHILSEEDKDEKNRLSENTLWIIDPLDGTLDFVEKTGEFTVMIALVKNKKPIIGVIYWPTEKILYVAQDGNGALEYSNDSWKKITVSQISDLKQARCVGSRNHLSNQEKKLIKNLEISKFTSIGSSLKACKVSSGEADVYLTMTNKMKEWDSCASNCIITEAGGKMTDMLGNKLTYNNEIVNHQNGILVSNGVLHQKILSRKTISSSDYFSDSNVGANSVF